MNPQQPTREQYVAHLKSLIAQRVLSMGFMEKQLLAKRKKFDIAILDLQAVPAASNARRRAELLFEAEQLEFESTSGQLDMLIEGTRREIEQYEDALNSASSSLVLPGMEGVVM